MTHHSNSMKKPTHWTNSLNDYFSQFMGLAMTGATGLASILFGVILLLLGDTPLGVFAIVVGGILVLAAFPPHT
jgi:hypothetical protein